MTRGTYEKRKRRRRARNRAKWDWDHPKWSGLAQQYPLKWATIGDHQGYSYAEARWSDEDLDATTDPIW